MVSTWIQQTYNEVLRDKVPRVFGVYAGVPVRNAPILDRTKNHPNYKYGFLRSIEEGVDDGDTVCLVGFGRGVSSVYAVRAGAAEVIAYEGAREMIEVGLETLEMQGLESRVSIRHAIVGDAIDLYGTPEGAGTVSPADLPNCDVLVLDCEGAEIGILDDLESPPDRIIVETHPPKGAPDDRVRELLSELGYATIEANEYEPDRPEKSVLVATDPGQEQRVATPDAEVE